MWVKSSAPGKLVLLGEYSVLFGHPAVVVAVNRRARVDLRAAEGETWSVAAPGFAELPIAFDLDRECGFQWREPETEASARLILVERVVGSLVASKIIDPEALPPASITLDTREFFQSTAGASAKLGLGSSAALTVALTEALGSWAWEGEGQAGFDLGQLLQLHRSFQSGRGSGIDLAASFTGGALEYRLTDGGRTPSVSSLELPGDLRLVFLWTGRSASTASFLERLEERMQNDQGGVAASLTELGRVATTGIAHLCAGDVAALLDDVSDFGEAMEQLGHAAGIPILSDEHLELRRLAADVGVRYKPSGAGGGDIGIGFTDDTEAATEFAAKAADAGFLPLDLEVDPKGVSSKFIIHNS